MINAAWLSQVFEWVVAICEHYLFYWLLKLLMFWRYASTYVYRAD